MGVAVSIVSAVLKSVVGDKIGDGLIKDLIGISIDEASGKGINEIANFINGEKSKIDSIFSKDNMEYMGIPEDKTAYVIAEIKELLSKIDITDEVFRRCKYNNMILKDFMWEEYVAFRNKPNHIECESEIKTCIFALVEVLNNAMRESEDFSNKMLIQISNAADDANIGLRKISEYMEDNFAKLDNNSQIVLNILLMILEQIQTMNMKDNETNSTTNEVKKFKNNKKEDYIKTWNSRLFLHIDNDENPITLADAFIMPDYRMYERTIKIELYDTLDNIIDKFIEFNKTSTMLITGVPGIGKSSITSWIANEYKNDNRLIVLRFRDWKREILEKSLLFAICTKLECENEDLENKILVIDGFDEIKALDIGDKLLYSFLNDLKDFKNFKCIITSRPTYINQKYFQNIVEVQKFDIERIDMFYKKITGSRLDKRKKIESNLEVLGVPVILYMSIMTEMDISENPTKPELYSRIFAEKGGIFDKFSYRGSEYDVGNQILRDPQNIKKYLKFLGEIAFSMFEKNDTVLLKDQFEIPELYFQGKSINVLEFPIKYLLENDNYNFEFIHKSIYEYFVAEYIFLFMKEASDDNKIHFAGTMEYLLKRRILPKEILEFLKFKIRVNLYDYFDTINEAFELMLKDGLTYHTRDCYEDMFKCEMNVLTNMLEIMHLWEREELKINLSNTSYLRYNNFNFNLENVEPINSNFQGIYLVRANLEQVNFKGMNLEEANLKGAILKKAILVGANLKEANLVKADLTDARLRGADLSDAYLNGSKLVCADLTNSRLKRADLRETDLSGIDLSGVDLSTTYLRGANLSFAELNKTCLSGLDLSKTIFINAKLVGANMTEANLAYANMRRADLKGAILQDAYLYRTDLSDADLRGATLTGTFVKGIHLKNANLSRIDLKRVDLSGVDLFGVIFDENQINYLGEKYDMQGTKVIINNTEKVVSYEEYQMKGGR